MGLRTPTSPCSPSPCSPRQYSTFLKAQESSPTLVLAHARIGDSGAQEVAEFASKSVHLRLLDLTGCEITSTGVLHLAEVLRCSITLESLVLRHNDIMSGPAGEEGLAALCQAAASSSSLRHLDLRHCGVHGESAAAHVASILQGNGGLSHLELSWNHLEPSGGQVLLDGIRKTSGLYDCQLTGCRLADETLRDVAELLLRNRKAHKASMQAGPYKGSWLKNNAELEFEGQVPATPSGMRSQGQAAAANHPLRYAVANIPSNAVVSDEKTAELIERLFEVRHRFLPESSSGKITQIHEFLEYLQRGQADAKENRQAADEVINRTKLMMQGFEDREMRYRKQLAQGRDELLDHSREYSKLQGNLRRSLEDLSILREDLEIAMDEMKRFERHCEDDADRDYSTFVAVTSDRKELERKLAELKDRGHHLDVETKMLRTRAQQVNVPWSERAELTLEQKLEDAAQRLQVAQEELQQQEQHVGSGRYPLTLKTRKQEPDFASRAADAQRMLRIQRDPRFLELQEALNAQTAEVQKPEKKSFMGTRETKESWKQQLSDGLRKLIQTVNMSLDPSMAEKQLENVYRWYVASRPGFSGAPCQAGDAPSPGRPAEMGFYNFCADEVLRHPAPPGSAYFTKEDHEGDLMTSQSVERVEEADTVKMLAGRPMAEARLASPKERLKDFSTRAIVRPLTARKLKDLAGERPEEPNRPLTPSTTEGGFTARSLVSARSTAVAGVSRPTSAMSMAQSAVSRGATPTPRSVARRPQSAASVDSVVPPLPQTVEENTNPAPEEYTLPYPGTEAEWNMERRWMLRRNRAITDKVMGQERNSALRAWAERRARVEEEISRTAEATRFQCALKDRRYIEPPDAEEDIEATVTCEDESSSRPSHTPAVRRSDPPRIDVSQPQVFSQVTRFAVEKPKQKPLNSRIAHLRRIHAHLLADAQISDPDSEEDRGERDNSAECNTLSAYAPTAPPPRREDDSDVLIGVCDWWKHFHADPDQQDGTSAVLDEMRFHQMQEVEEIKRVFSIRNVPLKVPVLERALVMPAHKMNPGHLNGIYLVNTHPDLLSNPFIAKKKKKLKKKRGKSAKKGKAKSRSSSAKGKKK